MGGKHSKKQQISDEELEKFIAGIRPLDLIVFRGSDLVSDFISVLETKYVGIGTASHCEVAISREYCSNILENDQTGSQLLSWGSTMSGRLNDGVNNAETGGGSFGVQVRSLRELIRVYIDNPQGNVGYCRLINNPLDINSNNDTIKDLINSAYAEYNNRTYDANPLALLGGMFPALRPLRNLTNEQLGNFCDVNKWLFCSEFAALLYIKIGIITDDTDGIHDGKILDPADVLPVDFLGKDADKCGIINRICHDPVWIKSLKPINAKK